MAEARIVQLSDTHLSAAAGEPRTWTWTMAWLRDDVPDLVVHSGDIVLADPEDEADRSFARRLVATIPCDVAVIPGNHDVGEYHEGPAVLTRRAAAFGVAWGADRFSRDLAGWRVVGVDAYLLGQQEHDAWFRTAVSTDRPVMVFVHQPVRGDRADEWRMTDAARAAFDAAIGGADVRVIASGHRHRWHRDGPYVWCPSLTITGQEHDDIGDPALGFVEHRIGSDGSHDARVVRPGPLPPDVDRQHDDQHHAVEDGVGEDGRADPS